MPSRHLECASACPIVVVVAVRCFCCSLPRLLNPIQTLNSPSLLVTRLLTFARILGAEKESFGLHRSLRNTSLLVLANKLTVSSITRVSHTRLSTLQQRFPIRFRYHVHFRSVTRLGDPRGTCPCRSLSQSDFWVLASLQGTLSRGSLLPYATFPAAFQPGLQPLLHMGLALSWLAPWPSCALFRPSARTVPFVHHTLSGHLRSARPD